MSKAQLYFLPDMKNSKELNRKKLKNMDDVIQFVLGQFLVEIQPF